MDDSERRQRVIGLATQFYYAHRDGKDPYDPEVTAGLWALVEGFDLGAYSVQKSMAAPQTPDEFQVVISECVQDAAGQVARKMFSALTYMMTLFSDLALYAERTSPDVDVPKFLHQAGLRAASDE